MIHKQHKILVVDDLADWRKTLTGLLKDVGYDVKEASSSFQALKLLETDEFDLAVVDIRLDETDEDNEEGMDLAKEIKKRWKKVKVILITGYGTPDRLKRALEPQATTGQSLVSDYIPKTETDNLITIVERVLES